MATMKKATDIDAALWESGIDAEVDFWRRWLRDLDPSHFRLSKTLGLQSFVVEKIPDAVRDKGSVDILELGSGPLCGIGKVWGDVNLNIRAVDPLADHYTRLLGEVGIEPIVPLTAGKGEDLLEIFGDTPQFDFIYCANALDHSLDPALIIKNMLRLTRDGCTTHFTVHQNEAEFNSYQGLHQWNFDTYQDRIIVWNRDLIYFLDEILDGQAYEIGEHELQGRVELAVAITKGVRTPAEAATA